MFFLPLKYWKRNCWYSRSDKRSFLAPTDKKKMFVAVKVRFKQKLKNPIKLEDIKKNGSLTEIPLIKQSRLSVMPIDSKSWKILNKMGNI